MHVVNLYGSYLLSEVSTLSSAHFLVQSNIRNIQTLYVPSTGHSHSFCHSIIGVVESTP